MSNVFLLYMFFILLFVCLFVCFVFFRLSTLADYSACCIIVGSDIIHDGTALSSLNFT